MTRAAGDSITRYQFINFAYFLTHGLWASPQPPDNENENTFKSKWPWPEFFSTTNTRLNTPTTSAICDCYRSGFYETKRLGFLTMENRIWRSADNTSLYFFQVFGDNNTMQIHDLQWLNATCRSFPCRQAGCPAGNCNPRHGHRLTRFRDMVHGVVESVRTVSAVQPVDTVLFNSGFWVRPFFVWLAPAAALLTPPLKLSFVSNVTLYAERLVRMRDGLVAQGVGRFIWKSTTPIWRTNTTAQLYGERALLERAPGWEFFDSFSVPYSLMEMSRENAEPRWLPFDSPRSVFYDWHHLHGFVNRALNELLLMRLVAADCPFYDLVRPPPCTSPYEVWTY